MKPLSRLALLCLLVVLSGVATSHADQSGVGSSPLNATYVIDGKPVTLNEGKAISGEVHGAVSKSVVRLSGEPAWGDLNGDGVSDAAVLLTQTTGGTGTFYYIAAALNRNDSYEGTDAIYIGDRINPQAVGIHHSLVIVDYKDRPTDVPMAEAPTEERSRYLLYDTEGFREVPLPEGELLIAGEVVIGHEVRAMQPCGEPHASWILGDSPALVPMQVAYHLAMSDASPYAPLFMIVTGTVQTPPDDGFGAEYASALRIGSVVKVLLQKSCN